MIAYDPLAAPDPAKWRRLSELAQIDLVLEYHRDAEIELPNEHLHAVLHSIVETQAAAGQELPVAATLIRLQNEGLDRHEAIHAVAGVLSAHMQALLEGSRSASDANAPYFQELYHLTAKTWLAQQDPSGST